MLCPTEPIPPLTIKVIGMGCGGGHVLNALLEAQVEGVEYIAMTTDLQVLRANRAPTKLVTDTDVVVLTAGLGGGVGTGATPVVAHLAKVQGCLTVAVVTLPFRFEGRRRLATAAHGLAELRHVVDLLMPIPKQGLLSILDQKTAVRDASHRSDAFVRDAIKDLADMIQASREGCLGFDGMREFLSAMRIAHVGIGNAKGQDRAIEAARQALFCPLFVEGSLANARRVILNITGGSDLTLFDLNEASSTVRDAVHRDTEMIFHSFIDEQMESALRVTVIAA
jgi:cell division protein FtsZ